MIEFKYDEHGLLPAIIQDWKTNEVLMLAYMNKESIETMLKEGKTCFYSRSRKKQWLKGEESGHFQFVKELYFDCDKDTLLVKVEQVGGACHEGYESCFFRKLDKEAEQFTIVGKKVFDPASKYTKK
jgi:phosphoribosyl-AMP cyclohydrolase